MYGFSVSGLFCYLKLSSDYDFALHRVWTYRGCKRILYVRVRVVLFLDDFLEALDVHVWPMIAIEN